MTEYKKQPKSENVGLFYFMNNKKIENILNKDGIETAKDIYNLKWLVNNVSEVSAQNIIDVKKVLDAYFSGLGTTPASVRELANIAGQLREDKVVKVDAEYLERYIIYSSQGSPSSLLRENPNDPTKNLQDAVRMPDVNLLPSIKSKIKEVESRPKLKDMDK
ncbi:MAG: hypothetical protein NTY68_02430 [Candidatus Micrarchaeota archaeon]|nr:hypothetical protein [Candidatus Micrarchaeota archaeon]